MWRGEPGAAGDDGQLMVFVQSPPSPDPEIFLEIDQPHRPVVIVEGGQASGVVIYDFYVIPAGNFTELAFELGDFLLVEGVIEVEDGAFRRKIFERVAGDNFNVGAFFELMSGFRGQFGVYLQADNRVLHVLAEPVIDDSSFAAADIDEDVAVTYGDIGEYQRHGAVIGVIYVVCSESFEFGRHVTMQYAAAIFYVQIGIFKIGF